jgi:hypothetical protein
VIKVTDINRENKFECDKKLGVSKNKNAKENVKKSVAF